MFGGNNNVNRVLPGFIDETQIQYQNNAANQLQLFGNLQDGCNVDLVNFGNEHIGSMIPPNNKRSRDLEDISNQQRLQISLNYNARQDEPDRSASIPNPNHVSTGLRLSYDDDERNSTVTSASGSITTTPIILSLGDNFRTELDRQQEELDHYIKLQEQLLKGVRDMKQKHMTSLVTSIEKGIGMKLKEKDVEIENMNRKNKDLVERIKQVVVDAQNWHYRAKYNESVVNVLRNNLQQAISHGVEPELKEGFGDSEVDDASSYIDPNNFLNITGATMKSVCKSFQGTENLYCRACKEKEVCMLMMPCRHLCLCKYCDGFIDVCPVCQLVKTASFEVYLS
ncbi:BOI-related E3 ubiquitin-protein ligase 1 isoform X2 [Vicia villosa]|uniref:BOI-related E3 ubiquitin-protein ligase 1 isoform X2 n=1 Tax=Vicia villosa TaxID=3911 RepID=UPI00273ADC69|nr:BOI-related E3 ubiquitin-protein ligase 1 isoform X2 [Vicia villosa]